jgi:hypothetical protein
MNCTNAVEFIKIGEYLHKINLNKIIILVLDTSDCYGVVSYKASHKLRPFSNLMRPI